MKRPYGEQAACSQCGQDIEWHGRKIGWIDRGSDRTCRPFYRGGELVKPRGKHRP